jgi:hypothetical protein
MNDPLSTEKYLGFFVCLAIGGIMLTWTIVFAKTMSHEIRCKQARQAYFDAGYHAALTRDEKLIAGLDDYRATYKAACRD